MRYYTTHSQEFKNRMKLQTSFILYPLITLLSGACGNIQESTSAITDIYRRQSVLPQGKVSEGTIDGDWITECIADATQLKNYTLALSFQKGILLSRTVNYADQHCQTPTLEEERLTTTALDTSNENNVTLTENFVSIQYRPFSDTTTAQMNSQHYCGFSQWAPRQLRIFVDAKVCGLNTREISQLEIWGNQELHLKMCATTSSTDCKVIKFTRNTGRQKS